MQISSTLIHHSKLLLKATITKNKINSGCRTEACLEGSTGQRSHCGCRRHTDQMWTSVAWWDGCGISNQRDFMVLTRRRSENPSLHPDVWVLKNTKFTFTIIYFFSIFTWTGTKLPPTKVLAEIREEELTLLWGLNMQFAGLRLQRRWKWQSSGSFVRFIPQLGREKGGAILLELKIRCFE